MAIALEVGILGVGGVYILGVEIIFNTFLKEAKA